MLSKERICDILEDNYFLRGKSADYKHAEEAVYQALAEERGMIAALLDKIGQQWRDTGEVDRFYAVNHLIERLHNMK